MSDVIIALQSLINIKHLYKLDATSQTSHATPPSLLWCDQRGLQIVFLKSIKKKKKRQLGRSTELGWCGMRVLVNLSPDRGTNRKSNNLGQVSI